MRHGSGFHFKLLQYGPALYTVQKEGRAAYTEQILLGLGIVLRIDHTEYRVGFSSLEIPRKTGEGGEDGRNMLTVSGKWKWRWKIETWRRELRGVGCWG